MKRTIFALATMLLLVTSCKKDKKDSSEVTVANLSGSYKISKITALVGSNPETDVTDVLLDACDKDDIIKLNSNMTLQWEDRGVQCSPPNTYSDTWSLPNNTTIVIEGEQGTIRKFDGTNLEVSIPYQGTGYIITYYVKQ